MLALVVVAPASSSSSNAGATAVPWPVPPSPIPTERAEYCADPSPAVADGRAAGTTGPTGLSVHRHRQRRRTAARPQSPPDAGAGDQASSGRSTSASCGTDDVRRIVVELLVYLACHDHRHLRVGQIQIGLRPLSSGRPEIAEKTLRNYLSELRQWIGAEHLPESSAKGATCCTTSSWTGPPSLRLTREADASRRARRPSTLRTEALALVRGRPFEDVLDDGFEWVEAEHLDSQMAGAIAGCAVRLASDHLEAKDYAAAPRRRGRAVAALPRTRDPGWSAPGRSGPKGTAAPSSAG